MSDVSASGLMTASGNVTRANGVDWITRARIKAIHFKASTGGTITLRDGGAAGPVVAQFAIPVGSDTIPIPGDGLVFRTDVYLVVTTAVLDGLTVLYTG